MVLGSFDHALRRRQIAMLSPIWTSTSLVASASDYQALDGGNLLEAVATSIHFGPIKPL